MKQAIKKILNFVLLFSAVFLLLFEVVLFTRAQDEGSVAPSAAPAAPAFLLDQPTQCVTQFTPFFQGKKDEFAEFINTHFQSELPASDLIPAAVEKYRQFRGQGQARIDEIMKSVVSKGGPSALAANRERAACEKLFQNESLIIKELLRLHIVANAAAKKSTRLLDRYKQLNRKLGQLNSTLAQFYGYFSSLSQRLPCFATQCTKG